MNSNYKIVSIEGNIGSGKSTLLENLRKYYRDNEHVIFLREPVDDWEKIKDSNGITMLQKFYEDQDKYSFAFQIMAYISRLKILRNAVDKIISERVNLLQKLFADNSITTKPAYYFKMPCYVIITERSLYADKYVFAKMLHDQGKIEDVCYQIYLNWFDEFVKDFPLDYLIYVNTEPNKCCERIHKRAREGEETIPLDYLNSCHDYHEEFVSVINNMETSKLVLNGNIDIYTNEKIVEEWIDKINKLILD